MSGINVMELQFRSYMCKMDFGIQGKAKLRQDFMKRNKGKHNIGGVQILLHRPMQGLGDKSW